MLKQRLKSISIQKWLRLSVTLIVALFALSPFLNCSPGFQAYDSTAAILSSVSCDTANVSFAAHVKPVLDRNCVACHSGTNFNKINIGSLTASSKTDTTTWGKIFSSLSNGSMPPSSFPSKPTVCEVSQMQAWVYGTQAADFDDSKTYLITQREIRPLTVREYNRSLQVMLGLPENFGTTSLVANISLPFDNNIESNVFSQTHINSFEYVANLAANAFVTGWNKANYIPCVPAGPGDRSCLEQFATRLYTLAYRRPVVASEVQAVVNLAMTSSNDKSDFNEALKVVILAALQDPQFLYRFEVGTRQADGSYQLSRYEYLSKLSFFLRGGPPTIAQINQVAAGALDTEASVNNFVLAMINDPKATESLDELHSYWFGFYQMDYNTDSTAKYRLETKALINKIISQNLPWSTLLTSNETWANDQLAQTYDLEDQNPTPAVQSVWVDCAQENGFCNFQGTKTVRYGAQGIYITKLVTNSIECSNNAFGRDPIRAVVKSCQYDNAPNNEWRWRRYKGTVRQGFLSHGTFLSVGNKFGEVSTSRRGYNMQKALFCSVIGAPPTVDENGKPVSIDDPPESDVPYECKEDLFRNTVLKRQACASCHNLMDTLAFGLDQFAVDGSYKGYETGKPQCTYSGNGEAYVPTMSGLQKIGNFNGPKQLADLALRSGLVEECLSQRLLQFNSGRTLASGGDDKNAILKVKALNKKSSGFRDFLQKYVTSPEFRNRKGM